MFNKTSLVSVSLALPSKANKEFDSLILNGIRISLGDGIYSEIEEQNCFALNNNDYDAGLAEFELQFEPIRESYCSFWIGCTSIRTERKIHKLDPPPSNFKTNFEQTCQTKITYENKMAATICCLPRKTQKFDKQNPKNQQPVETVEKSKKIVQYYQKRIKSRLTYNHRDFSLIIYRN